MRRKTLAIVASLMMALLLMGTVARVGGRDVASGTGDFNVNFRGNRERDVSIYPVSADINVIFNTADTGVNDTMTVPGGVIWEGSVECRGFTVDRTNATRVVITWVGNR